jgi:hypothetical protein
MNRAGQPRDFFLTLDGVNDRKVNVIGVGVVAMPVKLSVDADKVRAVRVLVTVDRKSLRAGSQDIAFTLRDAKTGENRKAQAVFITGENR